MFAALKDINVLNRRYAQLLAYGINLAVDKYNEKQVANGQKQLIISPLHAEDFEKIVLSNELDLIAQALRGVIRVLNDNAITQVVHLKSFIQNKEYLTEEFLTEENAYAVINAIEPLTQLSIIPTLVKAADKQIYLSVANIGLNIDHSLDLENAQITEDLGTIVNILRKAVEFGALEFVYAKNISDINYEILDDIPQLDYNYEYEELKRYE